MMIPFHKQDIHHMIVHGVIMNSSTAYLDVFIQNEINTCPVFNV